MWIQLLRPAAMPDGDLAPCLFLDRDGVIVAEIGYLHRVADIRMMAGVSRLIASANKAGLPVVMVTNQSGIGRGLYGWSDFISVQNAILRHLGRDGATIDAVLACPHHPDANPPYRHADHPARKPNPGMLTRAASLLAIDLRRSWIVGDHPRDVVAGLRAGLAGGFLVNGPNAAGASEQTSPLAQIVDRPFTIVRGNAIEEALSLPLFAAAGNKPRVESETGACAQRRLNWM